MSVALLFPGQGSQSVGMGRDLAQHSPAARAAIDEAARVLGDDLVRLASQGPAEELDQTVNAQPALLMTSIALLRALEAELADHGRPALQPAFLAGHSMGQYSAMVAAGALSLADGLRLVRERGERMQASAPDGAMAAIIGLDDARLPELLEAGSGQGIITLANRNAPGQVVISGARAAVEAAADAAKGLGAKRAIVLPVSVASHSPLMARAAEGMATVLADVAFADPSAPLLSNAEARPLTTGADCRTELVDHLTQGVDWVRAVEVMAAAGVTTFVEVGPGKVLTGLVKRIAPDATAVALDDPIAPGGLAASVIDVLTATPAAATGAAATP